MAKHDKIASKTVVSKNTIPPMVGVPSLFLCQRGPMSNIFCPIFIERNFGMILREAKVVQRNEKNNAISVYNVI